MATSRRAATNESISTYGSAGRNYTSLATWEDATDVDLVTATTSYVLECYDDAASFNDYVSISGGTTNATYFRIIRSASGQGHDGTPNNGFTIINTTDASTINMAESYCQIQDLIIISTQNSAAYRNTIGVNVAGALVVGCIIKATNAGAGQGRGIYVSGPVDPIVVANCLAFECKTYGFNIAAPSTRNHYLYNCTSIGNAYGFQMTQGVTAGTVTLVNCLAQGNTTQDFYSDNIVTEAVSYCASADATADDWGGTGNHASHTFTFVSAAGDDWHLDSTDVGAIDLGADLSADGVFAFNDDINNGTMGAGKAGETRSGTWDIGFDEYVASGTAYTQTCAETVSLADSKYGAFSALKTENITTGEATSKLANMLKSDALTLGDYKFLSSGLSKSEALVLADSIRKAISILKSETLSISESKIFSLAKRIVDSITIGDYVTATLAGGALTKALSETMTFAENAYKAYSMLKAETLTIPDSLAKGVSKQLSDVLYLTIAGALGTLIEGMAIGDYLIKSVTKRVSDSLAIADYVLAQNIVFKVLSETLTVADSLRKLITSIQSETLTVIESTGKLVSIRKSDALTFVDSVAGQLVSFTIKALSENISIAESFIKAMVSTKAENLQVSDYAPKSISITKADTLALSENIRKLAAIGKSESLLISDDFRRVCTTIRVFSEALSLIDSLTTSMVGPVSLTLTLSERIQLADAWRRIINLGNLLVNEFASIVTDDVSDHFDVDRIIGDDISGRFGSEL